MHASASVGAGGGGKADTALKVGVIERYFMSSGGAERVTLSMLRMLAGAGHKTVLYTLRPPAEVPEGVRVEVPPWWRRRPTPPLARRYSVLHTDHRPLFGMARDSDVIIVSDWGVFMGRNSAERVLFYFHSQLMPHVGAGVNRDYAGETAYFSHLPDAAGRGRGGGVRARVRARLVARRVGQLADPKIVLVPNSEFARGRIERAFGRRAHGAVYPPVDVRGMARHAERPKAGRAATVGTFDRRKMHDASVRIAAAAGVPLDVVGGTLTPEHERVFRSVEQGAAKAGGDVALHRNAARPRLEEIVGSARVYLHACVEDFGISVVEGIAAGCVPVVPNNSAHVETVPFAELRYDTEGEAAEKVRAAADGRYDSYLPRLREHAMRFAEEGFHRRMLALVEGRPAPA